MVARVVLWLNLGGSLSINSKKDFSCSGFGAGPNDIRLWKGMEAKIVIG